jgi:NAD(P)-dependent dehydrogenase (short-subunit alcohol dehydrogenase family)
MNLEGRTAIVTGAGHRVGRALAVALGREKMNVAVHYNSARTGADETVSLIENAGGRARSFGRDLTQSDGPSKLVEDVVAAFGTVHVLVNSAATMTRLAFGAITVKEWDDTFNLNLRAPFFLAQASATAMTEGGAIVNISDLAAFETWPSYLPHSITKSGIVKMTEGLARILAPSIRVNAIAPGAVLLPEDWGESTGERLSDTTPLRRLGNPEDVVDAMLYLLHADYVTGATIVVDGGRRIRK